MTLRTWRRTMVVLGIALLLAGATGGERLMETHVRRSATWAVIAAMAVVVLFALYSGIVRDRWPAAFVVLLLCSGVAFLTRHRWRTR